MSGAADRAPSSTAETLYAALEDRLLVVRKRDGGWRTTDGGDTWERAMDGLPEPEGTVRAVLAAGRGSTVYALVNRGLYRSRSAGASWEHPPVEWPEACESQTPRGLAVVNGRT